MRGGTRLLLSVLPFVLAIAAVVSIPAAANDSSDRPHSPNMQLLGSSLRAGAVTGPPPVGPGTGSVGHAEHRSGVLGKDRDPGPL